MKKSTLIILLSALALIILLGVFISNSLQKGPQGSYVCTDEFFGYDIKFDGKYAYAGKSTGEVTVDGDRVTVKYHGGTVDEFIYDKESDTFTDVNKVLTWVKK